MMGDRPCRSAGLRAGRLLGGLLLFGGLLLLGGCRTLQIEQPTVVGPEDWLTEGKTAQRAYAAPVDVAPPLEEAWTYNAGAGFGPGSALLVNDAVVVATRKGEVHTISLETGRKTGMARFGDSVDGTPLVHRGVLYVPVAWGRKALVAYDLQQGRTSWVARHAPIEAGIAAEGDRVFAADFEGTVRAYDARTGQERWTHALGDTTLVRAALVLSGGHLFVADEAGRVTALDPATGALRWQAPLGQPVLATPAATGETLFVPTTRGRLVALDVHTGERRWSYDAGGDLYLTTPAVDADALVVGGSDGRLVALDPATGTTRWTFDAPEGLRAAPLLTAEHVYVATLGEHLYALDRTAGRPVWDHELKGRVKSALAAQDGRLVVLSESRLVYLFHRAEEATYAAAE